jgi:hypothetical protein
MKATHISTRLLYVYPDLGMHILSPTRGGLSYRSDIDTNSRSLRCYLKRNRSAPTLAVHSEPVREPWEIILKAMVLQFYRALKTAAGRIPATSSNSLTAATTTRARLLRDRTWLRA